MSVPRLTDELREAVRRLEDAGCVVSVFNTWHLNKPDKHQVVVRAVHKRPKRRVKRWKR